MEEPVKASAKAAAIADAAEQDVLRAYSVGMVADKVLNFSEVVCKAWDGPSATQANLSVFSDVLDTVQKVAEKPSDTSYSGYIKKFRENAANAAPKDIKAEQDEADKKAKASQLRCAGLYEADVAAGTTLASSEAPPNAAMPLFFTRILGLDQLVKAILSQAEAAQREAAVRKTIEYVLPQLEAASKDLRAEPTAAFGPRVRYKPGEANEATQMNTTALGATITIRRWFLAQQIQEQWRYLRACQERKGQGCLGDPAVQSAMNSLVLNVRAYRSLAKADSTRVLTALDAAIEASHASLQPSKSPSSWIDALVTIGDAVSSLSDAWDKYEKSKAP